MSEQNRPTTKILAFMLTATLVGMLGCGTNEPTASPEPARPVQPITKVENPPEPPVATQPPVADAQTSAPSIDEQSVAMIERQREIVARIRKLTVGIDEAKAAALRANSEGNSEARALLAQVKAYVAEVERVESEELIPNNPVIGTDYIPAVHDAFVASYYWNAALHEFQTCEDQSLITGLRTKSDNLEQVAFESWDHAIGIWTTKCNGDSDALYFPSAEQFEYNSQCIKAFGNTRRLFDASRH